MIAGYRAFSDAVYNHVNLLKNNAALSQSFVNDLKKAF
jgi:hypothetical protein